MEKRIWIILAILIAIIIAIFLHQRRVKIHRQPFMDSRPNIIVIMTDQERYHMHWPNGWAENNLTSYSKLKRNGLEFTSAYTSATECCPSRAVMVTGEYYPLNGVAVTSPMTPLSPNIPTIGTLLSSQGYDVVWKGKWHLSQPVLEKGDDNNWSEADIGNLKRLYGLSEWNPPDAANILDAPFLYSLGGGNANNDGRYVKGITKKGQTPGYGESVVEFLKRKKGSKRPFCLFVSLANPHDVWVYPKYWREAGYKRENFADLGIDLPQNYHDDLSGKPSIQKLYRTLFDAVFPLPYHLSAVDYVNFYAYLHKVVDSNVNEVLDSLERTGLLGSSVIVRTSDHGEAGLSHGLRQKAYSVYEEMIKVPLVISSPLLFSSPKKTSSLYSHANLLPTLSEIAGVKGVYRGDSIVPILKDPETKVQSSILFAYDDVIPGLTENIPSSHIRAIRAEDWTYAVYYSLLGQAREYELYNLKNDPLQLTNLAHSPETEVAEIGEKLHIELTSKIQHFQALQPGVAWPETFLK